ncbi:PDZ domain-containing protein [Nannocystis sp. RBIL2]|uniref:PDZ domain-containing protein n=1 Tax=Nannocystis sp. RBIL2 TaxID=2996788 RepID=UPI002271291C|nr:PDZ domain-containing protein [Nannocystis sp. RBIL2]MCY1070239.1 PDZ domain-containing protein [Nannocystis sp. RBIL2]
MFARIIVALSMLTACTEPNPGLDELRTRVAALESQLKQAQVDIEALKGELEGARTLSKLLQDLGGAVTAETLRQPDAAMDLLDEPPETATEFSVARTLLAEDLLRQGRFVPAEKDGKLVGLKVFGIRADSTLKAMGLKNGDVLLRVDGAPLESVEALPAILQALPQRDRISLDIERKTRPLTLTITVT